MEMFFEVDFIFVESISSIKLEVDFEGIRFSFLRIVESDSNYFEGSVIFISLIFVVFGFILDID